MAEAARPRYSFVVPVHNEQESLAELVRRLTAVMDGLDGSAEAIFVDDGSTDESHRILIGLRSADERLKVIRLSRNFGHQLAITAGTDRATGDAIVIMDADLQDPPELVPELIARWREGFEVVYAVRQDREGDSRPKRMARRLAYRVLKRLSNVDIPLDAGDFRLVDRRALDAFRSLRENNRYVRGMFAWIGFDQTGVTHRRPDRFAGTPKYGWSRLIKLGVDGVISFSDAPLRLTLTIGFLVSASSFVFALVAVALRIGGVGIVPGWASLVVLVSFLGGVQLVVLGTIGLYVARIHEEVKGRPLYIERELHGFDDAVGQPAANAGRFVERAG
jgi:polyisoprenyl-phosphate glycosyltransferase